MRTSGPTQSHPTSGPATLAGSPAVAFPEGARPWWEEHFLHHWDAHHGSARTAHVMGRLLAALQAEGREYAFLSGRPLDVLDWGCAFGEGAQRLAEAFPLGSVTGLDVAEQAVRVAGRRYPTLEFVRADDGRIPREFDVVVAADRLGHVADPLAVAREQIRSCRWLYVALVPGREEPLPGEHRARFDPTTFPARLAGFTRICSGRVELDPAFGGSPRRLVVYASPAYLTLVGIVAEPAAEAEAQPGATEPSPSPALSHLATTGPASSGDSRLARALAESVARLAEREAQWAAQVDDLRAEQERRSAAHASREAELAAREAALVARLDERGRLIDRLTAHINTLTVANEEERIAREYALDDLEARLTESLTRTEAQAAELAKMTGGRAWKLVQLASAAHRKLAPRAVPPILKPRRHPPTGRDAGRKAV